MTTPASPPIGVHPAAELFPMLESAELAVLAADIAANGLLEPIVCHEGLLLDGRNRRRACELAGKAPWFVEWQGEGGSPVAFIASRNLHRRHLSESQRAAIAARVKAMFEDEAAQRQRGRQFGHRPKSPAAEVADVEKHRETPVCADLHRPAPSNDRAAAMFNVSARLVALASRVITEGEPLLLDAIDAGQVTVCDAAAVLSFSKEEQRAAVAAVRSGDARTLRQAAKRQREERLESSQGVPGLPHIDPSERHSPKRLRRVAKNFDAQCETLLRYLDLAAAACGGANDYTRRMRENVELLRRTMHQCANDFGRSVRPEKVQVRERDEG